VPKKRTRKRLKKFRAQFLGRHIGATAQAFHPIDIPIEAGDKAGAEQYIRKYYEPLTPIKFGGKWSKSKRTGGS
jgi:hypothetical protein